MGARQHSSIVREDTVELQTPMMPPYILATGGIVYTYVDYLIPGIQVLLPYRRTGMIYQVHTNTAVPRPYSIISYQVVLYHR